jgi:hypothetical protein
MIQHPHAGVPAAVRPHPRRYPHAVRMPLSTHADTSASDVSACLPPSTWNPCRHLHCRAWGFYAVFIRCSMQVSCGFQVSSIIQVPACGFGQGLFRCLSYDDLAGRWLCCVVLPGLYPDPHGPFHQHRQGHEHEENFTAVDQPFDPSGSNACCWCGERRLLPWLTMTDDWPKPGQQPQRRVRGPPSIERVHDHGRGTTRETSPFRDPSAVPSGTPHSNCQQQRA